MAKGYYLAIFKVQESYKKLSMDEKLALLKREWIYGQELALKGIRVGGYLDQPNDLVYGFYLAESQEALQSLLEKYPTEIGHYAIERTHPVVLTQNGRISLRTPLKLILGYFELWFMKLFRNSSFVNNMLEKRISG